MLDADTNPVEKGAMVADLGAPMTADSRPRMQCWEAVEKTNRTVSKLQRTILSENRKVLLPLYGAYLRPHLKYVIPERHPALVRDNAVLNKVQRWTTRMFQYIKDQNYEERR